MIKAWCGKKKHYVNDGKAVKWCFRVRCKWLRFQMWYLEKKLRR